MFTAGKGVIHLTLGTAMLQKSMAKVQKSVGAFGRRLGALQSKLGGWGTRLVGAAGLGASIKVFADFEQQLANVSTMLDEPEKHMAQFKSALSKMSTEFGESTATLSSGLYDILSASIPPEKALAALDVAARAAKAGMSDTGTAADALTTVMNSYGLAADQAGDVSDWLFSIVKRGKTNFPLLAGAIGNVASTASQSGVSMEELGSAIATVTRAGVKTDVAMTSIQAIISSFLKPTDEAAEIAKKLGFEMNTATLRTMGLEGVMKRIGGMDPEVVSKLFPNVRALKGLLPALGAMEGFGEDMRVMANRAGATQIAYDKMAATLTHRLAQMKQAGIGVFVALGESLAPMIGKMAAKIKEMMPAIEAFIQNNGVLIAKIVGIGAAIAGVMVLAPILITAFSALGTVIGLVVSPIGLVIAGLVAVAKHFYSTRVAGDSFGEKMSSLKTIVAGWWSKMAPIWEKFKTGVTWAFVVVKVAIRDWRTSLKLALVSVAYSVLWYVDLVKHHFTKAIPNMLAWFGRNWKAVFIDAANALEAFIENALFNIMKMWEWLKSWVTGGDYEFEWTPLLEGFERTMEELPDYFEGFVEGELTQKMGKQMKELGAELAGNMADEFAKYTAKAPEIKTSTEGMEDGADKLADKSAEIKENLGKGADKMKLSLKDLGLDKDKAGGAFVGLAEAMAGLQEAAVKGKESPQERLVGLAQQQLAITKEANARDKKYQDVRKKYEGYKERDRQTQVKRRVETTKKEI